MHKKTIEDKIKEVQAKVNKLNGELNKLHDAKQEPECKSLIGKYFKYRSCFSCPEKESDYWWVYSWVKDYKDGKFYVMEFGKNSSNEISFSAEKRYWFKLDGHISISKNEFWSEYASLLLEFPDAKI